MTIDQRIEYLWHDLRYAIRVLSKSPTFAVTAIASLGLGIGVNTAVFSVVNAVLIHALPFPEPGRLLRVVDKATLDAVSMPEFEFCKKYSGAFEAAAAYRGASDKRLVFGTGLEWIKTLPVSGDFLRTLGTKTVLGREFNFQETKTGGPKAIILTDSLWRTSFAADPNVLGKAVSLNDALYTVVGVIEQGYWFPQKADALVPLRATGGSDDMGTNTQVIARLKPGVSIQQETAEMVRVSESFRGANPSKVRRKYRGLMSIPFQDWLVGDVRLKLVLVFGTTVLLLVIACSNLASLLITRLASRGKEIALRQALGSGSGRLLQQFLMENLVITALGALAGLLSAYWALDGLVAMIPFRLPGFAPIRLDRTVLIFTLVTTLASAALLTLLPFLTVKRLNVNQALASAGRHSGSGTRERTRNILVTAQVALSASLLIAAALLIQSLYRLHEERLGFETAGLISFETPLASDRHRSSEALSTYIGSIVSKLATTPGVLDVAAVNVLPLTGPNNLPVERLGHPDQGIGGMEIRLVTPSYFKVMKIAMRQGRFFTESDRESFPAVALVNEALARRWWPGGDAVRDRLVVGRLNGRDFPEIKEGPREVVGIVGDTKTLTVKEPARPTIYLPMRQASPALASMTSSVAWVVRANGSSQNATDIRQAITGVDRGQRMRQFRTMDELVASTVADSRFDAWLFGMFAFMALVLTATGLYGLVSYSVARRYQEIGTRIALGAPRSDVITLILRQGLLPTLAGLGLGLGVAFIATRWLSSLLYGVKPGDPVSFLVVAVLLIGVGLTASYLPARRATRIEPMQALRTE